MDEISILMESTVKSEDEIKEESFLEEGTYEELEKDLSSDCLVTEAEKAAGTTFQGEFRDFCQRPSGAGDVGGRCSAPQPSPPDANPLSADASSSGELSPSAAEPQRRSGSKGDEVSAGPSQRAVRRRRCLGFTRRRLKCEECGKRFDHAARLQAHKHPVGRILECQECGKVFEYASQLQIHQVTHTGERAFQCNLCGKAFARKSILVQHQHVHTKERPFECKICGKCFTNFSILLKHERVHSGERPFQCKLCQKTFTRSSFLVKHARICFRSC